MRLEPVMVKMTAHKKDDPDQNQRPAEDRPLKACDNAALRGIVFHQIYAPNDRIVHQDRRRSVAFERVVFIDAGKDVITIQRLHDRLEQDEFSLCVLAGHRIVERAARCVGHDEARDVHIANDRDDLLRRLLRQRIYTGK